MRSKRLRFGASRLLALMWLLLAPVWTAFIIPAAYAAETEAATSDLDVMKGFVKQSEEERKAAELTAKERHQILFVMGATLLILLLTTGGLGIAMGVMGKPLFVPHMIFAGLSITLALAHSIAAVVWFFPF